MKPSDRSGELPRKGSLSDFPRDWVADYRLLEPEEYKAFHLLHLQSYLGWIAYPELAPGLLPDDDRLLQRTSGLDPRQWGQVRKAVLSLFTPVPGVGYRDEMVTGAVKRSDQRSVAAIARWSADAGSDAGTDAKGDARSDAGGLHGGMRAGKRGRYEKHAGSHARTDAAGDAGGDARADAGSDAPIPFPSSLAMEADRAAETEDGSRSSLEIPSGFPQLPQPDDYDARARGLAPAALIGRGRQE